MIRTTKSSDNVSSSSSSEDSGGDVAIPEFVASQLPPGLVLAPASSMAGFDLDSIMRGPVGSHPSIADIPSSESDDDDKMSFLEEAEDRRSGWRQTRKGNQNDSSDDDIEVDDGDGDNEGTPEAAGITHIHPQPLASKVPETTAQSPRRPNLQAESVESARVVQEDEALDIPAGFVKGTKNNGHASTVMGTAKISDPQTGTASPASRSIQVDVPSTNQEPPEEPTTVDAALIPEGEPTNPPLTSAPLERQPSPSPRGMAGRLRSRSQVNLRHAVTSTPKQTPNARITKADVVITKPPSRVSANIARSTLRLGKRGASQKSSQETPYRTRRSVSSLRDPTPKSATDEPPSAWTVLKETPLKETPSNSSMMVDELHSSPMTTQGRDPSTGGAQTGNCAHRENPLFILTESQVPFPYSQRETPGKRASPKGSEDEVEAETFVQPTPGRATAPYRKLTEIASEHSKFMTPSLRPASFPSTRQLLDYGTPLAHEVDDIDTEDTSDSDAGGGSHIPKGRRAGNVS